MFCASVMKFFVCFRPIFNDWNHYYEKLTDMIVPRSSQLISQDQDYGLFTVTLFKKVVDEFKLHAREKKLVKILLLLLLNCYLFQQVAPNKDVTLLLSYLYLRNVRYQGYSEGKVRVAWCPTKAVTGSRAGK